ncbi:MAG TPA: IPT/TIG domain-containing protein [Thermoanaerobaculia bacterium]
MTMRSTGVSVITLLFAASLAAQQPHVATPVDQLLAQYWAAHPEVHDHHNHHMIAEMETPKPAVEAIAPTAGTAKRFTVTAHGSDNSGVASFGFTIDPPDFVVNQGDSVTIDFKIANGTHGFLLEQYFQGGTRTSTTINFIASTPGEFTYVCTNSLCGLGHPNMVGTFTVNAPASPPSIASFTPTTGTTSGGTVVAITGTNFASGATVKFGDAAAVSTTVNSSTSISAISPAHAAGDVTLTVTNPDGQSAAFGTFTFAVPGPAITSITPPTGSNAFTTITISGSGFVSGATVTIGGAPAESTTFVDSSTIKAVTPPGPVDLSSTSAKDVTVINPNGQSVTRNGGFTYSLLAPVVSEIFPGGATPNGGSTIAITGSGFSTGVSTTVTFGGVAGTNVHVISPVLLTVVAPAHAAGTVDLAVTVGSNTATAKSAFTYQTPAKKRRSLEPR